MQQYAGFDDVTLITPDARMSAGVHGGRAKCLQRLIRLEMPVPRTVSLSFGCVGRIAEGQMPDMGLILSHFGDDPLLSVRPSSEVADWGGPGAILNIGMNDARHAQLSAEIGEAAATGLYLRFVQAYAVHVARLDADAFHRDADAGPQALKDALRAYGDEMDEDFPQDPHRQLSEVLQSMARAWNGTSARLLRQAKGAPADAGLGLVVQRMALGVGGGESGSGVIQFVDATTGQAQITGRYLGQSQGREALVADQGALFLTRDPRGPSLEERAPEIFAELKAFGEVARTRLREEMQIEFTVENDTLKILDAVRVNRSAQASVRIATALAADGVIAREEALMRVQPAALSELLHRQVDARAKRDRIVTGVAASPGAASGRIVFSAAEAQASAARGEPCILVRRETTPDDIRGMHEAQGVLTLRGGTTSHAAVIGRGLGLPCVVGASDLTLSTRAKELRAPDGRVFTEGTILTVDGTTGDVLAGEPPLLEAALDDAFLTLMDWAGQACDIGIRANADTPRDARTARNFSVDGIGLCRTEHMFFDGQRLAVMLEMIFADGPPERAAALDRLLPMQRDDFVELFKIMKGKPVCIRLFDPPLHEFLPSDRGGLRVLADGLGRPQSEVTERVEALKEHNPMLGMRGVRLGITFPEIYQMQARAIFEATVEASRHGAAVVPEIMIPLVSARREVELVKSHIDAVAAAVQSETGSAFSYKLGVMVETPRAALKSGEIAESASFLSFGTNDLTQMTYGLSRDDAGRFMSDYVRLGVYEEDPFMTFDTDGVGELVRLGAERGRDERADVVLSICGEHGGSRTAIAFCRREGFDYVSCSPFRVPVARLSAAQLAIADRLEREA